METKKESFTLTESQSGVETNKVYSYARRIGISSLDFEEIEKALKEGGTPEIRLKYGPKVSLESREGRIYVKNTPAEVVNADAAATKGALLHQSAWHKLYLVLGSPVQQTTTTAIFQKGGASYTCDLATDVVIDRVCGGLANIDTTALVLATQRPLNAWRSQEGIEEYSSILAHAPDA